ncbi:MAG TPA: hypothetical protein VMB51_16660 [Solirubrobacteraceae bacterium]|nr:hypothetical protein [Solirubrobacteraceae bacterium]
MTALGAGSTSVGEAAAQSIAEAALAAEGHAPQGLVGTALQGVSPAERLTKQIEEISKSVVGQTGAGWAEQLGKSYATDVLGTSGVAGLGPDITKRMQESLATAGLIRAPRVSGLAGLADASAINKRFAKQLSDIAGAGLASQWSKGALSTGLLGAEHLRPFKAIEEMMAETKRMEAIIGRTTMPGLQGLAGGGPLGALDQQLLRSPLAAKGFFPTDRLTSMFGESSITSVTRAMAEAALGPLAKDIASLGAIAVPSPLAGLTVPSPFVGIFEREREIDAAIERVAKRWETSALWFLFTILSVGQLVALARMEHTDVEAVLLDALEAVVTTGTFAAALMATIKKARSCVTADQRDDLLHGLEHAQAGEFSRAAGPLTAGLEGALWGAGRELEVIDGDRRLLDKPERGKIHRVEMVVRKLPAVQEFRKFVCGRVFGDLGNPLRHGEQSDRRQRSLFAIVAVAGWIEAFMKVPVADALGTLLSDELASRTRRRDGG